MSDSNKLIKNITYDIISIVTVWGLVNSSYIPYNFYININNKYLNYNASIYYKNILIFTGIGISFFALRKYY